MDLAVLAVRDRDQTAAQRVVMLADAVREQSERLIHEQAARLASADPDFLFAVRLRTTAVDKLQEVYRRAKRIARGVLPPALAR